MAHLCAWHVWHTRIRTRRGRERSESTSGERFPARGSRTRTAKAGTASAATEAIDRNRSIQVDLTTLPADPLVFGGNVAPIELYAYQIDDGLIRPRRAQRLFELGRRVADNEDV